MATPFLGFEHLFCVCSVYLFATWCRELQKWSDTDVPCTTKAEKNTPFVHFWCNCLGCPRLHQGATFAHR